MKNFIKKNWFKIIVIIGGVIGALGELPDVYYLLFRWLVFGSSLLLLIFYYVEEKIDWLCIFGFIAIANFPETSIHIIKYQWHASNVFIIMIFTISLFHKSKLSWFGGN